MTAFNFMANAFYVLVGVVCFALAALVVFIVLNVIIKIGREGRRNGRKQGNQDRY